MSVLTGWRTTRSAVRQRVAAGTSWIVIFLALLTFADARDLGQWGGQDSPSQKWFESLRSPSMTSCCGAGDGYWADDFEMRNGKYVAIVTDTRPDEPLQRAHIDPGTRFVIPDDKITKSATNPTGHGWIFVYGGIVFCYLPSTGV